MQLTGKYNYRQFRDGCRAADLACPDFVEDPDAVNTRPWEGLVLLFYWDTRGLNRWADEGAAETITKKINGGQNGVADRFDRLAPIVLLGCPDNIREFQADQRSGGWVPSLGGEEDEEEKEEAIWSPAVCNSSALLIIPMSFHTPTTMLVSHTASPSTTSNASVNSSREYLSAHARTPAVIGINASQ